MNFNQFLQELINHDWTAVYSDDQGAFKAAEDNRKRLVAFSQRHPIANRMFKTFCEHYSDRFLSKATVTPLPNESDIQKWLIESNISLAA